MLHYFWKVKLDTTNPLYYAAVVAVLLSARVWQRARKASAKAPARVPVQREA